MKLSRLSRTILFFVCVWFGLLYPGVDIVLSGDLIGSGCCSLGMFIIGVITYWIFDPYHFTGGDN